MKHGKMILGELHADIPVIQGGMGVGISLSGLAGAVAAAGGIGIISTAQIGFREPDFDRDPIACNLRTIGKEIEKARQIAKGGIVGVNIMVATQHYEDYVRAAVHYLRCGLAAGSARSCGRDGKRNARAQPPDDVSADRVEPPCPVGRHEILDEKIRQKAGLYRGRGTVGRRSSGI